ncbi:PREDICTED: obscurin-like, partial [Galeopterus variegatus]|uniref:Obscurin-like n=1 Tax=Galeopterus variegatus TaxID=482537 RepID=A0ABM0Q3D0_GALVR
MRVLAHTGLGVAPSLDAEKPHLSTQGGSQKIPWGDVVAWHPAYKQGTRRRKPHLDGASDRVPPRLYPEPAVVFAKDQPVRSEMKAGAGASATLSCEVAQTQTEVTWYKDGKKLSSSSKVRMEAAGCIRRLVVQKAGKVDAGEYTCEAGGQSVSFYLDVTEPKAVFAKDQPVHSEVKAEAGTNATLSCKVAQAQTEVTWYKDGKKLISSSKVHFEATGCTRRLVVQKPEKVDAGEYSCEAGGRRVSFHLDVT